jgi:hypothetical protein
LALADITNVPYSVWEEQPASHTIPGSFGLAFSDILNDVSSVQSRLGTPSNLGSGATAAANLVDVMALLNADVLIDTSTTPWAIVWIAKGTGGIGVGTELLRKRLFDTTGSNIGNTTTVLGRQMQ